MDWICDRICFEKDLKMDANYRMFFVCRKSMIMGATLGNQIQWLVIAEVERVELGKQIHK